MVAGALGATPIVRIGVDRGRSAFAASQLAPPVELRWMPALVPAKRTPGGLPPRASAYTERALGRPSRAGLQCAPPSVLLYTPEKLTPAYTVDGLRGSTASA